MKRAQPPSIAADAAILPASQALKGRGTAWAIDHRFMRQVGETSDDGWGLLDQLAVEERIAPATQVIEERVKSILASNDSPDISFDLSVNPYRGCEHVMWREKVLPDPCLSPLPDFF